MHYNVIKSMHLIKILLVLFIYVVVVHSGCYVTLALLQPSLFKIVMNSTKSRSLAEYF